MSYLVQYIGSEEKEQLYQGYEERYLYTAKADVYGCCIKLLTDIKRVKDQWDDNFYAMSENIRSHGRMIVLEEPGEPMKIKYDPYTKTIFLINVDYYGWIKSIALAVAGDILEDAHRLYSIHGAAMDVGCLGVSIIGPPGTGKTTHSWGLMRAGNVRFISDDWYFVRLTTRNPLAFGSEKNSYVQADIGKIWNEYERVVDKAKFDKRGRALVNARWIVGRDGVIPMTTMRTIILLKRDPNDKNIVANLNAKDALQYVVANDFCNPHQLVRDKRKFELRKDFFRRYFEKTDVYLVNTTGTPQESQTIIRELLAIKTPC